MAKKEKRSSSPSILHKLGIVFSVLAGIVVLKQVFLLLVIGMLPTVGSYFTDREKGRPLFKTVFSFNFAGVFYFVVSLISTTPIDTMAVKTSLQDMSTYLTIYSSAALAYLVFYSAPYVTFAMLSIFTHGNLMRLRGTQQRLLANWGPDLRLIDDIVAKEVAEKKNRQQ